MKFYFQLDSDNIIRDAITYPYEGYTEVELDMTHLPAGINAGYYRWDGASFAIDPALKPADESDLEARLSAAEAETAALNLAIIDLWETIANGGAA
ncbi:hypothetical protein [Paenibacillus sp. FSL R5-0519]|uniref:hypothetical protein n=1 Tax=Paenibacillus sp. FSL R5-0519 TaxID=2921648 RepID=UPI0030DBFF54